jgi:hypothetical protein
VEGPVIQTTAWEDGFEDGLGLGESVSGYSYHMSVRTGLPDHMKQSQESAPAQRAKVSRVLKSPKKCVFGLFDSDSTQ